MIVKRLSPRLRGGDAVLTEDSPGSGGDGESRQAWHRCNDGERSEIFNVCISQLSNCCSHSGSHSNHDTPSEDNHSMGPVKCPALRDSTTEASAANSFSIVDWIQHNLPCVQGSHHHHVLSSHGDQHHEQRKQQQQQQQQFQQNTQRGHEPLKSSTQQASAFCSRITQAITCPITAPLTFQQMETNQKTITDRSKDLSSTKAQTHQKDPSHPPSSCNHTFTTYANPSTSWLTGHLGLIQQTSSYQLTHAKPTSLVKTTSLTKPSSFNKTPSCPQPYSRTNKQKETAALTSKPPRPQSPAIPPQLVIKRTKSQIIASQFQKIGGSSRSNSRPSTPINLVTDVQNGCSIITCLPNAQSLNGIDSNSSVGLNSVHERPGREGICTKANNKSTNSQSSCVVVVDPLLLSCGNHHNFDEAMFHQANNNTNDLERSQSKLTVASQSTMDTGGTSATHNTHTLHNILTKGGSNHASLAKTATMPPHEIGNISVPNAEINNNETPKAGNANGNTHVDGDSFLRSESSLSGNMPSQQPLLSNNFSRGDQSSTFSTLRNWSKRSPSPLFGGTQVQLEKLLSKNHNKSNHGNSESGTTTTDGASGFDASTKSNGGDTSTFSSVSGVAAGEKRKVQWGVSTYGGSSKMPVLIAANEDSTEVIKRESKTRSSIGPAVDVKSFAKYHEEIVTALIDGALRAKDIEDSSAKEPTSPTVTSTPEISTSESSTANAVTDSPRKAVSTPIRKIPKSPHRTSFSTPLWKKNKSTIKLDSIGKIQKHERKTSEGNDSNIEKAISMFHFKTKQSTPITHSSTTTLDKKPLDYFHPQCQLLKEKGSDKRKSSSDSKTASAIGKEAVLEKLQEKLSMLGDIESGKFGKAAEMLQSDAVAFFIESDADSVNQGNQQEHAQNGRNNIGAVLRRTQSNITRDNANDTIQAGSVATSKKRKAMVETRSLLTLRMGFVSMSYGILLQWDCSSKSVELIVLRKMCREDFLERNDEDSSDALAVTKSPKPSTASAASTASGTTLESHESHSQEPEGFSRFFPQLLCEPDRRPQSFLSVSVVSVKHIHTGCALCMSSTQSDEGNSTLSKIKQDTIRPYIRFVLGKNEHCTKPAKLLANGNLHYYKKHNNSCLLPMPREEFRWFAGQEDLIVEVRDMQTIAAPSEGGKHRPKNKHVLNKYSSKHEQHSSDDPILAVVTVPLSSVNIEDDGEKDATSDDDESAGLSLWKHRKPKKNEFIGKDDISSTNITLPLRMTACSAASFGSISLQITIKAPYQRGATPSSVSAPSDSDSKKVNESRVVADESIEIGAIARLMQGWAIYDAAAAYGETDPVEPSASSKSLRKKIRPRWNKKWNPKTKKWSKLKLNNHRSSGRDQSSEEANWFTFMKWGDDPTNSQR